MSEKVKAVLSLTIICFVVSLAVVFSYIITKPHIERSANEEAYKAMESVLPEVRSFEEIEVLQETLNAYNCTFLRKAADSNAIAMQIETRGYQSGLVVMVGVGEDSKISGVRVVKHSETEGIGTRAMTEQYLEQYKKKGDTTDIELISGATYTSEGIKTAVKKAIELFEEIKKGDGR